MKYKLIYSTTCRNQIQTLPPPLKKIVRWQIEELLETPTMGKALSDELAGIYSLRAKRHRILYSLNPEQKQIELLFIGHRESVYETFTKLLKASRKM